MSWVYAGKHQQYRTAAAKTVIENNGVCLVRGLTVRETAREIGVCERTIDRRLRDPRFVRKMEAAQAKLLDAVIGKLIAGALKASEELTSLLTDASPLVRVGASRAILEYAAKFIHTHKMAKRYAELLEYVEKSKENSHANPSATRKAVASDRTLDSAL